MTHDGHQQSLTMRRQILYRQQRQIMPIAHFLGVFLITTTTE